MKHGTKKEGGREERRKGGREGGTCLHGGTLGSLVVEGNDV